MGYIWLQTILNLTDTHFLPSFHDRQLLTLLLQHLLLKLQIKVRLPIYICRVFHISEQKFQKKVIFLRRQPNLKRRVRSIIRSLLNLIRYFFIMILVIEFQINPIHLFAFMIQFYFFYLEIEIASGYPCSHLLLVDFLKSSDPWWTVF